MERNIAKISGKVFAVCKQAFLLLRDTVQPAVVVDHDGDGQIVLKGGFNRQAARQKRAIAGDNYHIAIWMQRLGRDAKGHSNPKQRVIAGVHDPAQFLPAPSGHVHRDL